MNEENFHEDHQQVPTPEEEPQGEKKEGSSMRKVIYGLLAVAVLVLTAVGFSQEPTQNHEHLMIISEGVWEVDLTDVGLGMIRFSPSEDLRDLSRTSNFAAHNKDGLCDVVYNPDMYGRPLSESRIQDPQFDFVNTILNCGLELEVNSSLAEDLFALPNWWELYDNWLEAFESSCGESLYRVGWTGDLETDTDLSCVPSVAEEINKL